MDQQLKKCQNCSQNFPENKIDLHEAYCRKNIRRCKMCVKMIDINDEADHNIQFHSPKLCIFCKIALNPSDLERHVEQCSNRPILCKYCQNPFPFCNVEKHQQGCGSRTKQCILCRKYIKLINEEDHQSKCKGLDMRRNESQQGRRLVSNKIARQRMNSNQHYKKQTEYLSQKQIPVRQTQKVQNKIPVEMIRQLVDPVPISVKLTYQKQKQKFYKKNNY